MSEILMGEGAAPTFTPGQLALLGAAFFGIALMSVSARRRRRDRQQTPEAYLREHVRRVKEERVVVDEAEAVARRLEQFAREMHAQIQTHIARLECACREADRRIMALGGSPVSAPVGQALDVVVADAGDVSAPATAEEALQRATSIPGLAMTVSATAPAQPMSSSMTGPARGGSSSIPSRIPVPAMGASPMTASPMTGPTTSKPLASVSRDELRLTALRLSEEGHDVRRIAGLMRRSISEVELLIAAARQQRNAMDAGRSKGAAG